MKKRSAILFKRTRKGHIKTVLKTALGKTPERRTKVHMGFPERCRCHLKLNRTEGDRGFIFPHTDDNRDVKFCARYPYAYSRYRI